MPPLSVGERAGDQSPAAVGKCYISAERSDRRTAAAGYEGIQNRVSQRERDRGRTAVAASPAEREQSEGGVPSSKRTGKRSEERRVGKECRL